MIHCKLTLGNGNMTHLKQFNTTITIYLLLDDLLLDEFVDKVRRVDGKVTQGTWSGQRLGLVRTLTHIHHIVVLV